MAKGEIDIAEAVRCRQPLDFEDLLAKLDLALGKHVGDVALDHQSCDGRSRGLCNRQCGDVKAVAHDGHMVAELFDLVEIMRDIDDGHAFIAQAPDQPEEDIGLPPDQRRCRLVENQNFRLVEKGARNLHDLLFGRGQLAD